MGFFDRKKTKEDPDRREFREEFETVVGQLKQADKMARAEVGHSINMANSILFENFGSLSGFEKASRNEKMAYLTKIHDMEQKMQQEMPASSLGVGLFKMWLTTVMENDTELSSQFSDDLSELSKEGEFLQNGKL